MRGGTEPEACPETQSECDFIEFCARQHWTAAKLPRSKLSGVRTPDFLVTTMTGYEFVVEVTEFEPGPPLRSGESRIRRHTLGNPLRAKLSEKKNQVSKFSDQYPTLIVISAGFENSAYLDSISFDSALYGEVAVTVRVPNDPRRSVHFDDGTHNAGRRFFGPKHNTSISAVAALDGRPQVLRVYHNKHARTPLDAARTIIGTTKVRHFAKADGGASGWEEIFANPRDNVGSGAA